MHVEITEPQDPDLLVRGLAHRMNNILTVFHGYVGMMLENEKLDPGTRDGLARIKAGARAATDLIDRAHSLVRQPTVVWREIEPGEFVTKLRAAAESLRTHQATRLELRVPENLPLIQADASKLKTALIELLRNAFESTAATPAKSTVTLSVSVVPAADVSGSAALHEAAAQWISFAVEDDGLGIAPEIAAKVFQPFFSTKRKSDATGLGLNVATGLIQQCGGTLRHESRPGCTRFELLLPAVAVGG
jgi:two-component system cell cycle sensor histidine kinase/response regulator CckA